MSGDRDGQARRAEQARAAEGAAWRRAPSREPARGARRRAAPGAYPRLRKPGSLPYPNLPAGTDTIPKIEHIVVLMMENHSYDNKLGMLSRRVPMASASARTASRTRPTRMPTVTCSTRSACRPRARTTGPSQDWKNSHVQFASAADDGFVSPAAARSRWATGSGLTSRSTTRSPAVPDRRPVLLLAARPD